MRQLCASLKRLVLWALMFEDLAERPDDRRRTLLAAPFRSRNRRQNRFS